MILAILPDVSSTETLLNNLYEADFSLDDISVVMRDIEQRNAIAKDLGPLQGIDPNKIVQALIMKGVSPENAGRCNEAIQNGGVLVAMEVAEPYSESAREMFRDHSAQLIEG